MPIMDHSIWAFDGWSKDKVFVSLFYVIRNRIRSSLLIALLVICLSLGFLVSADDKDPPLNNTCSFDNANYTVGQAWHPFLLPTGYIPCIRCVCKSGFERGQVKKRAQVSCNSEKCKKVSCHGSYVPQGECCKKCPGDPSSSELSRSIKGKDCLLNGKTKRHGEVWTLTPSSLQDDQCTECSCMDSFISCAERTCRKLTCKIPVPQNWTCCQTCVPLIAATQKPGRNRRTGCPQMGRHYYRGDTWRPKLQGSITCVNCICTGTVTNCKRIVCPSTDCDNPVREHPGDCCANCPVKTTIVQAPSTAPVPSTLHPITNASRNPQDCLWYDKSYSHGSSWNPTVGESVQRCVVCSCTNTSISCTLIQCPKRYRCAKPKKVPDKCCPLCPGFNHTVNQTTAHPKNRRSTCSLMKYHWQVFEFVPSGMTHNLSSTKNRSQALFVLVDTRSVAGKKTKVELHQLEANATSKFVTMWNVDATNFKSYEKILKKKGLYLDPPARKKPKIVEVYQIISNTKRSEVKLEKEDISNFDKNMNYWHKNGKFEYIGIINEGRRRKIRKKESELCSEDCRKGVQVLIRIVKNRSQVCQDSVSVPPDTLRMLNEG